MTTDEQHQLQDQFIEMLDHPIIGPKLIALSMTQESLTQEQINEALGRIIKKWLATRYAYH